MADDGLLGAWVRVGVVYSQLGLDVLAVPGAVSVRRRGRPPTSFTTSPTPPEYPGSPKKERSLFLKVRIKSHR